MGGQSNLICKLAMSISVVSIAILAEAHAADVCDNGAEVSSEYCKFFVHFNTDDSGVLDMRIQDALKVRRKSETRAIGLVISISKYPNLHAELPAAAVDGIRLVDFLVKSQMFDEVILLKDEDATEDNINYFLEVYLKNRGLMFNNKARLLIAYSGHGRPGDISGKSPFQPAFILSGAKSLENPSGMYKMSQLSESLQALSGEYFHVLTLINACYGGSLFRPGERGENPDAYTQPGSYGITAGDIRSEVYSLDAARGSVFIDSIISGVESGAADSRYSKAYILSNGEGQVKGGITRTNRLFSYITDDFSDKNLLLLKKKKDLQLKGPWLGATQTERPGGGFFFLTSGNPQDKDQGVSLQVSNINPESFGVHAVAADNHDPITNNPGRGSGGNVYYPTASSSVDDPSFRPGVSLSGKSQHKDWNLSSLKVTPYIINPTPVQEVVSVNYEIPYGPVSGIPGMPEVKIFKTPDIYPIKGFDISSVDGNIDWPVFIKEATPRFVYVRAVGWSGKDTKYASNHDELVSRKIDTGAYFKFNFCKSATEQAELAKAVAPASLELMPPAILIVNPKGENKNQLACFNSHPSDVSAEIIKYAELLFKYYGKVPLLFGNHNNLSPYSTSAFKKYMVWVGYWGESNLKTGGASPWTLWQYSGNEDVKGIGKRTEADVFFGTEEQYSQFKIGKSNVALDAVTAPPTKKLLPFQDGLSCCRQPDSADFSIGER